jgi:uncharacterized protein (TIGR02996 family)
MNDHDALLNAIAEHPEEDTPRLMYADWLEENDQPERADFVRNQIELDRLHLDDPARRPLVVKNLHYLTHFVPQWKAELPPLPGIEWGDFNRGLIEEVQAAGRLRTGQRSPVVAHAGEIFAVPGIHILRLRWLDQPEALAPVPELIRLRALRLVAGRADAGALRVLLASRHLGKLTILDLHGNFADDDTAADIADGRFPELTELWLGNNRAGARGARALIDSPHLGKLRLLDLSGNQVRHLATRDALRQRFGKAVKF